MKFILIAVWIASSGHPSRQWSEVSFQEFETRPACEKVVSQLQYGFQKVWCEEKGQQPRGNPNAERCFHTPKECERLRGGS